MLSKDYRTRARNSGLFSTLLCVTRCSCAYGADKVKSHIHIFEITYSDCNIFKKDFPVFSRLSLN